MNKQLRSYIETVTAWLDGKPIQYCAYKTSYPDEADWEDWIGGPDDEPYYDGEFWRVKPGDYVYVRCYRNSKGYIDAVARTDKDFPPLSDVSTWVSEPILVKLDV